MIELSTHRTKGKGLGTTIGFPTINSELFVLPDGLTE